MSQSYTVVLDTEPSRRGDRRTTGARYRRHVALDRNRVDVHRRQLEYTADGNGHRTLTTPTLSMMIQLTITHTVAGGDYEGVAAADVEVTITEDDTRWGHHLNHRAGSHRRR